ncbi:MAG TPA: MgtC/SapB family protein [Clostridiales bacterium]|nr:MgtC/SapB family protein [Clostridiales bacterium]HOL91982.1 MgtC/SapB family protein [Clostridiales bacterium]HPP35439.1 MgtC/SapB family protein [Clostridiales bacterium]
MPFELEILARLLLAVLLGGFIGYEREHTNRPAGFRTHILVCAGAALVMATSEYMVRRYSISAVDPARLGAQVISGIGFLGAGTIIRDGVNVRGLTTAASLWAVSCVGIAVGCGFYLGAVIATILIFITLITLKKAERRFSRRNRFRTIIVESENISGQVGLVTNLLEKNSIEIKNIQLYKSKDSAQMIKLLVKLPGGAMDVQTLNELQAIEGVREVYEE